MSVSRCIGSEVDCSFLRCYKEVEYEKNLSTLVHRLDGKLLPDIGLSFVALRAII